ncbi:hypothetical protein ACFL6M_00285 [Candidatus Eisenbacteria bacterium]|uniref:Uncharacterized protein n=1 Tax=Eiseniibacteriota bacterium TaxID=2212470 RepID=A0ABV6YIJ9_UNCEI
MHRSKVSERTVRTVVQVAAVAAVVCVVLGFFLATAGAEGRRGLLNYREEVGLLVDAPGASASVAAGLFNPGALGTLQGGGYFLGWSDRTALRDEPKDWLAILARRPLSFSMQRFQLVDADGNQKHLDEYTVGLYSGNRAHSGGISYSWSRCNCSAMERHRRLTLGHVSRWRWLSMGLSGAFDLERQDNYAQADIGIRPIGPRVTFFADAVIRYGESREDVTAGYGIEARPVQGLTLAGKLRNDGDYSLRLELGLSGKLRAGGRVHFNKDGDHIGTSYALEEAAYRCDAAY